MTDRHIIPVTTQKIGIDPGISLEPQPSVGDRLDALTVAVEVALDPAAPATARASVLEKLRETREKPERPERQERPERKTR